MLARGIPRGKAPMRRGIPRAMLCTPQQWTTAGFHADLNETFFIGNVDDDSVR